MTIRVGRYNRRAYAWRSLGEVVLLQRTVDANPVVASTPKLQRLAACSTAGVAEVKRNTGISQPGTNERVARR